MNKIKKATAAIVLLAMLLTVLPATVFAANVKLSAKTTEITAGESVKFTFASKGFEDVVYDLHYSKNGGKVKTFKSGITKSAVSVKIKNAGEYTFYAVAREADASEGTESNAVTVTAKSAIWNPADDLRALYTEVKTADQAAANMALQVIRWGDSLYMDSDMSEREFDKIYYTSVLHTAFLVDGAVSYSLDPNIDELAAEFIYDEAGAVIRHILYGTKLKNTKFMDDVQAVLDDIIEKGMTDVEKARAIHDYIIKNYTYADSESESVRTAYGFFYNKKGVCEGYAELFCMMCIMENIPCFAVTGEMEGEGHMWNKVMLGGKWYNVDCTADDPVPDRANRVISDYFMLTDDELEREYEWHEWLWPAA